MEEVVLGRDSGVSLDEEKRELIVTCADGVRSMVDVKRTDALVDVRIYIDEYFNDYAKFPTFVF
eukprot:14587916-Ditylum_brightwellii.AAC.1